MDPHHPYQDLTPDCILGAIESLGHVTNGRFLALNSYENRVYQIGVEDGEPLVAKFYRPERWSNAAILEEHAYTQELAEREIPVVAPLAYADGHTLHEFAGFRFAVYPRRGGRSPELGDFDQLMWMGRFIARIHAVGALRPFQHRPRLDIDGYGHDSVAFLLDHHYIPRDIEAAYRSVAEDVLSRVTQIFASAGKVADIRLHGDCHPGNILWTDAGPHFVDFDDCRSGPAIQDLWMLLSGSRADMSAQLSELLEGYSEFHDFSLRELPLIEPLRSLRMLHYSAWLARRWADPAFPANFPWFNTQRYWEEQVLALREQIALLEEPPLRV